MCGWSDDCVSLCVAVGQGGVIKGWEERALNMTKAVRYNREQGTFTVEKAGVYFLFCQVSVGWFKTWVFLFVFFDFIP